MSIIPRLKQRYTDTVVPALMKQFAYKSSMEVPRLEKIVLNMGLGSAVQNGKVIDAAVDRARRRSPVRSRW